MYIDSRLIDSVTVYDNNILVEFGGFTGGSVDVTSRRWNGENSGHMYYRTTRSSWNHLFEDSSQPIDSSKNDISHPPVSRMNITNTISAAGLKSV